MLQLPPPCVMALAARVQLNMGHETIAAHPDFDRPWCKKTLADPHIQWRTVHAEGTSKENVSNSMFEWTLYGERGIRAHLSFRRPCSEPGAINAFEECFLLSIGDALDGVTGRAHGGLSSTILDHISGHAAHYADARPISPATATLTINYHRPVSTPCIVLARGWLTKYTGRKVFGKAVIEDEGGNALASATSLFILAKAEKL